VEKERSPLRGRPFFVAKPAIPGFAVTERGEARLIESIRAGRGTDFLTGLNERRIEDE
jgi:hypothetical protein